MGHIWWIVLDLVAVFYAQELYKVLEKKVKKLFFEKKEVIF